MSRAVLNKTSVFNDLSDSFKDEMAKLMIPKEVPPGHIVTKEGEEITQFMIVESGSLIRTKASVEDGTAITLDEIGAYGVTGFMHVAARDSGFAYATITAGNQGAKVWTVGIEFDHLLRRNPDFAIETIQILTQWLRRETKITRATLHGGRRDDPTASSLRKSLNRPEHVQVFKVMCYDTTSWVKEYFEPQVKKFNETHEHLLLKIDYTQDRLHINTASYAVGYDAVCLFVNDTASAEVIQTLSLGGVGLIAMRCAGFDRVDLIAAKTFGLSVARVPAYSPYAVAEHAIALLMTVNRKIHAANTRVKMSNFTLDSGLLGMDVHGKNVGILGTGKIGQILCRIVSGFDVHLLACDVFESDDVKSLGGKYVSKEEIFMTCDIIFLMMPLLPSTKHTINSEMLSLLKKGVIIINTSRGGLVETTALLDGIQSGIIGGAGIDVYENEGEYFFQDWSAKNIEDPILVALLGNNKVVMTAHQAFFTREAIEKIVSTTIENFGEYSEGLRGKDLTNSV